MRGLACNACNEEFQNEEAQKQHYKTEWHRYNLRRKVAGVPGVTEALFNLRIEALEAEKKKKEGERLLYKCALCNKEYTTAKAHANHLQSKLHVTRAAAADAPADAGIAGTRPAPQRAPSVSEKAPTGKAVVEDDEDSDDEWEEMDGADVDADEDEDGDTVTEMEEAGPSDDDPLRGHWEPSDCLFCGKSHKDFDACIEHMHRDHGFFIPDAEFLKDPVGMLTYLGLKITKGFMCLYCDERGKQFHSEEAVRKHMVNKSHCKLRYGDGEGIAEEELEDFYDFTSSYKTTTESSSQTLAVHDGERPLVSLASGGHELVIKSGDDEGSGKRIGSRDMARYFRQRPAPTDNRNGVMVNALVARYRSMGLATQEQKWRLRNKPEEQQRKASQRAEYIRSKIALKNNVIRNLPRNCEW